MIVCGETESKVPMATDPPALERVRFRSLAHLASQNLREAVISGHLRAGDRIREQQLAKTLGISQQTVREGLRELEYEGFVRKIPNKGTYVTQLTHDDIQQISEVRVVLEVLAVGRAAERLHPEAAERLREILEKIRISVEADDRLEFHRRDLEFHAVIWELSDNEHLGSALRRLASSLFAFVLFQQDRPTFDDAYRQHRQILEALLTGDRRTAQSGYLKATRAFWRKHHRVRLPSERHLLFSGGTAQ